MPKDFAVLLEKTKTAQPKNYQKYVLHHKMTKIIVGKP